MQLAHWLVRDSHFLRSCGHFFKRISIDLKLNIRYPRFEIDTLKQFVEFFNLDLTKLMVSPKCSWKWRYVTKWKLSVWVPTGLVCCLGLAICIAEKLRKRSEWADDDSRTSTTFEKISRYLIMFLILPYTTCTIVSRVFEIFDCTKGINGISRLDADPEILCNS